MFDAIVIGSGPAGVFTAYQLRPLKILILDVGYQAKPNRLREKNLYAMRRDGEDVFSEIIGERFESLHNLDRPFKSPKLKGPLWSFLTKKPCVVQETKTTNFDAVMSYSKGGLANAWGAGVLRFNDRDLEGFPFRAADLNPFYDELTRHIGITGREDDLSKYFGSTAELQTPMPLSPSSEDLMSRYEKKRDELNRSGISIGRTRAAILSEPHRGRAAYKCLGQDFFQPNLPAIYHPGYTLDELVARGEVSYRQNHLVIRFEENATGVKVVTTNLENGEQEIFESKKLFLAAGALNTARIVLESRNDRETKLPLLDNPITFVPLINPRRIGSALPIDRFSGGELIVLYEGSESKRPIQASFYSLGSPLRSDLLTEFPLSFRGNIAAAKYLLPGLAMLQIFYPDDADPKNTLSIDERGKLLLSYERSRVYALEDQFLRAMRALGFYSVKQLCKFPGPGSSIHYAGSLPMRENPGAYETDLFGKLGNSKHTFITDAANFPRLPSKNHTFTIMANAMRIAEHAKTNEFAV